MTYGYDNEYNYTYGYDNEYNVTYGLEGDNVNDHYYGYESDNATYENFNETDFYLHFGDEYNQTVNVEYNYTLEIEGKNKFCLT